MSGQKATKDIGVDVKKPQKACQDRKCPFHGEVKLRGFTFTGRVMSKDTHNSCTVMWERKSHIKKYERNIRKSTKIRAHLPACLEGIKEGDTVTIKECRPLSKTKNFVVIQNESN